MMVMASIAFGGSLSRLTNTGREVFLTGTWIFVRLSVSPGQWKQYLSLLDNGHL